MLKLARLQPERPVKTSLSGVFLILTKFYYLLNKINYIHTLRSVARSGGVLLIE
jgi:hypothetical protein